MARPESEAATLRRTLSAAEIAPFTADEKTTYEAYWDRLRELRAALEELRDGLRKTRLRPTEYPDSPDEDVLGPRSEVPESEDLD